MKNALQLHFINLEKKWKEKCEKRTFIKYIFFIAIMKSIFLFYSLRSLTRDIRLSKRIQEEQNEWYGKIYQIFLFISNFFSVFIFNHDVVFVVWFLFIFILNKKKQFVLLMNLSITFILLFIAKLSHVKNVNQISFSIEN